MYSIKQITGEELLTRYNEIRGNIDIALIHSDGEWTSFQVVQNAIATPILFHVWEVLKDDLSVAIASTRVIQYNNFTSLHIMTLGGNDIYDQMPDLILKFEEMVKEYEHIDVLEFTGRRGFVKQLTKVGWNERYTTMRKNLKGDNNV